MAQIDRSTSQFLDASRWIAALAVLASHVSAMFMASAVEPAGPGPGLQAVHYLENTGHLAVVVFFVVSGYLVGGLELLRIGEGRCFDVRRYAVQRFSRIYTVFAPALVVTWLLDSLGQRLFNASQLYTEPSVQRVGSLMYAIAGRDDWSTFVGNLLMLQTILVEPFGGNGPLWSLANEWWYYVVFGLFLVSLSAGPLVGRIGAGAVGLVILGVMPGTMSLWFSIWLLGVGAALLQRGWRGVSPRWASGVMVLGFTLTLVGMSWTPALLDLPDPALNAARLSIDLVAALAFAVGLVSARNRAAPRGAGLHRWLAGFSYTLYVVHFPALVFLAAAGHQVFGLSFGQDVTAGSLVTVGGFTVAIGLYAWCFAQVTERRTQAVRRGLTAALLVVR